MVSFSSGSFACTTSMVVVANVVGRVVGVVGGMVVVVRAEGIRQDHARLVSQ